MSPLTNKINYCLKKGDRCEGGLGTHTPWIPILPPPLPARGHPSDFPSHSCTGGGDDAERRHAQGTRLLLLPSFSSLSDTLCDLGHVGAEAAMASGTRCRKVPPDPPYAAATANALRPTQSRPGPWWVPVTFDDLKQLTHNQRLPRLSCCGLLCPRVPVILWEWLGR